MSLLQVRDLSVRYRRDDAVEDAVRGVSFGLEEGQTLGLVGASGSGKTATALALLRLLPAAGEVTRGSVVFRGRDLLALSRATLDEVRGAQIGLVFQEPMTALHPALTVGHQVAEVLVRHRGQSTREALTRVGSLFDEVGLGDPSGKLRRYPHQLSGGERQRVMIAMALACDPALIIADEPTASLDVLVQAQIIDLLRRLRAARGLSMLFITHDLQLMAQIADQVAVMHRGQLVEAGPVASAALSAPYTRGLLACIPRADGTARPPERGRVLLEVTDLTVSYRTPRWLGAGPPPVRAVDGVTFSVRAGTTLGLVGGSGCGKTTLARAVLRLAPATSGAVRFDGVDLFALRGRALRAQRRRMQLVFQDAGGSLNPRMTVAAMLLEPMRVHAIGESADERRELATALLREVGLEPQHLDRYPHEFSGGQRQRLVIARALSVGPELVICDEPVSAIDVSLRAQVLNLLRELQERRGLAYLFISHDLGVVRSVADEIAVMQAGRIVEHGPADEVWCAPRHDYTRALLGALPTRAAGSVAPDRSGHSAAASPATEGPVTGR